MNWSLLFKHCHKTWVQLILILVLALGLRIYKINNPVLDWHAFRQADTASVTREFVKQGIDLLQPRYHDLSDIQSGQPNPEGYRMVEFPIINAFNAFLIKTIPQLDLVVVSRFSSVLFSLGTIISLYWLIKQLSNHHTAIMSALAYACLPFAVFYSRVILPEPAMLFFMTLSLASFTYYLKNKFLKWWLVSLMTLSLALLLKPFVAFIAPVYLVIAFYQDKQFYKNIYFWLYPLLAIIPFAAWRQWITQYPAGIPASDWLLNGSQIRFKPAWFRWIFYERITKLILGFSGILLALFNFKKINKIIVIILTWSICLLAYVSIIATGNVRHDYYQNLFLPLISLVLGRGSYLFYQTLQTQIAKLVKILGIDNLVQSIRQQSSLFDQYYLSRLIAGIFTCILLGSGFFISWLQIKGYYAINHPEYIVAGKAVDALLPADAKVIAPAQGDTMFLFQTNRTGWPLGVGIEAKIEEGATHYVTVNDDNVARDLEKRYNTVKKTSEYLILDLTQEKTEE